MQVESVRPDDDMFTGSLAHYGSCGKQLAALGSEKLLSCQERPRLEYWSCRVGTDGRVTRHLVNQFDPAKITVADIMMSTVDFNAATFGVSGHYVTEPVNEFRGIPDGTFDVAIMGSLLTHLSESNAHAVLKHSLAKPCDHGVAVATIHGVRAHEMLCSGAWFDLADADRTSMVDAYLAGKYGFANYTPDQPFEKKTDGRLHRQILWRVADAACVDASNYRETRLPHRGIFAGRLGQSPGRFSDRTQSSTDRRLINANWRFGESESLRSARHSNGPRQITR